MVGAMQSYPGQFPYKTDAQRRLDLGRVLITGGTGSFGRALAKRLLAMSEPARSWVWAQTGGYTVERVTVLSRDELKQSEMRREFHGDPRLQFLIGDVRDYQRLRRAFQGVDVVIHAAAMKQVPACEYDVREAKLTNVDGAQNVVDAAIDCGVKRVIALSTDKAVDPINTYGRTKALAESIFVRGNGYAARTVAPVGWRTVISCVRYGNVVGSRGSVVPVWRSQLAAGRPITVTDPEMTRFWLTLDQAVDLVLEANQHMRGGEVFVPVIPSTSIRDMMAAVAPGCTHETIPLRPGEKRHEVLVSEHELRRLARPPALQRGLKFMAVLPEEPSWEASWADWPAITCGQFDPSFFGDAYRSDTNVERLTVEQLKGMIDG